tara:strand:+ start:198 stop:1013 length:816 start_codon:yes stop_codon:yes gene_type:complete
MLIDNEETPETKEPVKILLATPVSSQVCHNGFTLSCLSLAHLCQKHSVPIGYNFKQNQALLHLARNEIVYDFLKTDYSHLLMVDTDTGFEASDILKLISLDKDVIGAPISKKSINWGKIVKAVRDDKVKTPADATYFGHYPNFVPWEDSDGTGEERLHQTDGYCTVKLTNNEPLRVSSVGTGLILIKRRVFKKMQEVHPELEYIKMDLQGKALKMHSFFELIRKKDGSLMSEDISFCYRVNEMGMKTWVYPWMKTIHFGMHEYTIDFYKCV